MIHGFTVAMNETHCYTTLIVILCFGTIVPLMHILTESYTLLSSKSRKLNALVRWFILPHTHICSNTEPRAEHQRGCGAGRSGLSTSKPIVAKSSAGWPTRTELQTEHFDQHEHGVRIDRPKAIDRSRHGTPKKSLRGRTSIPHPPRKLKILLRGGGGGGVP